MKANIILCFGTNPETRKEPQPMNTLTRIPVKTRRPRRMVVVVPPARPTPPIDEWEEYHALLSAVVFRAAAVNRQDDALDDTPEGEAVIEASCAAKETLAAFINAKIEAAYRLGAEEAFFALNGQRNGGR